MKKRKLFLTVGTTVLGLASVVSLTSCSNISKKSISFNSYNNAVDESEFESNLRPAIIDSLSNFKNNVIGSTFVGNDLLNITSYLYDEYAYENYEFEDNDSYLESEYYEEITENHDRKNLTWTNNCDRISTKKSNYTNNSSEEVYKNMVQFEDEDCEYITDIDLINKAKYVSPYQEGFNYIISSIEGDYYEKFKSTTRLFLHSIDDIAFIEDLTKTDFYIDDKTYTVVNTMDQNKFDNYQSEHNNAFNELEIDSKAQFYYDDSALHIVSETKINFVYKTSCKVTYEKAKLYEIKFERKEINKINTDDYLEYVLK